VTHADGTRAGDFQRVLKASSGGASGDPICDFVPLSELLGDAVGHARNGFPVPPSLARNEPSEFEALQAAPGFASAFLKDGKLPKEGETLRQEKLADMIEHLGFAGYFLITWDFVRYILGYRRTMAR